MKAMLFVGLVSVAIGAGWVTGGKGDAHALKRKPDFGADASCFICETIAGTDEARCRRANFRGDGVGKARDTAANESSG